MGRMAFYAFLPSKRGLNAQLARQADWMIWISGIWRLRRAWESLDQAWSAWMPCEPVTSGQGIGWMAKMSTNDDHWQWQGLTKKGRSNCSVKGTSRQTIENRWGNPRLLYIAALLQVNLRHRFDLLAIWGHDTYNDFASLQRTIIDHNLWSTTSESFTHNQHWWRWRLP